MSKIASFSPYWLQIKFSVSLCSFNSLFFDQSVALEIHHSRHHCSVYQQSTWHSATRTRFWQKHINTLNIYSYARRGIKIGALKMQFLCIFPYLLNICRKFEFLISLASVATCLRWGANVVWVFSQISYTFQQCKNFENPLIFDKVTESLKVGTFLGDTVYI